jgi:hypothetical protein
MIASHNGYDFMLNHGTWVSGNTRYLDRNLFKLTKTAARLGQIILTDTGGFHRICVQRLDY